MHRLLPPRVFGICGLCSVVVGVLLPIAGPAPLPLRLAGVPAVVAGLLLTMRSAALFERADTNIKTFGDPGALVTTGPFRFSRNPMYLGFTVSLGGISLLVASLSAWVGPIVFWLLADRWYIPFEERRMEATFGSSYQRYRSTVRRWFGGRSGVQGSTS